MIDRADPRRRSGQPGRGVITTRAVRVRNACVRHAAGRLGLPLPGDEDLRALGDDVSLRDAVEWWSEKAAGVVAVSQLPTSGRYALRFGVITAVTLLGLALSYGRAQ